MLKRITEISNRQAGCCSGQMISNDRPCRPFTCPEGGGCIACSLALRRTSIHTTSYTDTLVGCCYIYTVAMASCTATETAHCLADQNIQVSKVGRHVNILNTRIPTQFIHRFIHPRYYGIAWYSSSIHPSTSVAICLYQSITT